MTAACAFGASPSASSFPIAGFSVPFSVTYASRTELIKDESEFRGNVGFTLDLDKFVGR